MVQCSPFPFSLSVGFSAELWHCCGQARLNKQKKRGAKMKRIVMCIGSALLSSAAFATGENFTVDVTQATTDYKTAGALVLGVFIVVFGYKLIRKLLGK